MIRICIPYILHTVAFRRTVVTCIILHGKTMARNIRFSSLLRQLHLFSVRFSALWFALLRARVGDATRDT